MQSGIQFTAELKQLQNSFIQFSSYDPTTFYLNDRIFDRDAFKQLKKEGLIEVCFENNREKHYTLSQKGRETINRS